MGGQSSYDDAVVASYAVCSPAVSDALPIGHMGHVPRASRLGGGARAPLPPQKKEEEEKEGEEEKKKKKKRKRKRITRRKRGKNEDIPMIVKQITKMFLFNHVHATL